MTQEAHRFEVTVRVNSEVPLRRAGVLLRNDEILSRWIQAVLDEAVANWNLGDYRDAMAEKVMPPTQMRSTDAIEAIKVEGIPAWKPWRKP